jgi:hypothetical protein
MTPPRFFLAAKHWQLFVVTVGLFSVGQLAGQWSVFVVSGAALWVWLSLWIWTLGEFMSSLVPANHRPDIARFRLTLLVPGPCLLVSAVLENNIGGGFLSLPLGVVAMFCVVYSIYFVSKCLRVAELGTSVTLSDYVGTFLLFWFHIVGVWFIQPRVNRLYAQRA